MNNNNKHTIIDILNDVVKSNIIDINVNEKTIMIMKHLLLKKPDVFHVIQYNINGILIKQEIDITHINIIVKMFCTYYEMTLYKYINKYKIEKNIIYDLIIFIIKVMIRENLIKTTNKNEFYYYLDIFQRGLEINVKLKNRCCICM